MDDRSLNVLEFGKVCERLAQHTTFSASRSLALGLRPQHKHDHVLLGLQRTREAAQFTDRHGRPDLSTARDVRRVVDAAARGRVLTGQEFLDIRSTLATAHMVRRKLAPRRENWPMLGAIAARIEECPALVDAIDSVLDEEGQVKDNASRQLARTRRDLRTVHDRLVRRLESMLTKASLRDSLQEALITQRHGRYVLPVKAEHKHKVKGVVHEASSSGASVFVEPLETVEVGNKLRELQSAEAEEVERLLRELSADVGNEHEQVGWTVEALSELDLAFACAEYAVTLGAVEPHIVTDSRRPFLRLPQARHPLLSPAQVVPVDVHLGDAFTILILTGPNTGGKTVTLKTVGLLCLMAQAGLFVPAGEAILTPFDGIYADIGTEQSIEQSLSTFSSHMTNLIRILEAADRRSLVLLDELGAGTDPSEGSALAEAIVGYLAERSVTSMVATHYSELKALAHSMPEAENGCLEFDPLTLAPTYKLTIGLPGRSNAFEIARRLGLAPSILRRARARMSPAEADISDLLADIRKLRAEAEADRSSAEQARREAERLEAEMHATRRELEAERGAVLEQTRRQAAEELENLRRELAGLERKARQAVALERVSEARREAEVLRRRLRPPPGKAAESELAELRLQPGTRVFVPAFNSHAEYLRAAGAEADVQIGSLRARVPLRDLQPSREPETRPHERRVRVHVTSPLPPMELDVRGRTVDEALSDVEAYLDRAVLAGLPHARIIHGSGTGALRRAVRAQLKVHPHVESFRAGEQAEGGEGVTVVLFGGT